jgi:photosystem II stability/assembly factor-like uncharacterized protein
LNHADIGQLFTDPNDSNVMFAVADLKLYRSTDAGATWSSLFSAFAFAIDNADPAAAYALGISGPGGFFIQRSDDSGVTWTQLPGFLDLDTGGVGRPLMSAGGGFVYVAWAGQIDVSHDRGETWQGAITLPGIEAGGLICLAETGVAYLATNGGGTSITGGGVFETRDGGIHWNDISTLLPDRSVYGLAVDSDGRFLHAATFTGVYDLEVGRPPIRVIPTPVTSPTVVHH